MGTGLLTREREQHRDVVRGRVLTCLGDDAESRSGDVVVMATIAERVEKAFEPGCRSICGLRVREQLLADLEGAVKPDLLPKVLAIFALGGFREYDEGLGRVESNALVSRFEGRLAQAVTPAGRWYRPRQDEFALLCDADDPSLKPLLDRAAAAVTEPGLPVPVSAAVGTVVVPDEASDPIAALRLADVRLAAAQPDRHPRDRRRDLSGPGTAAGPGAQDTPARRRGIGRAAPGRAIHRELAESSENARRTRRVDHLLDVSGAVTVLAYAARIDWTGTGKLLKMPRDPGRIPLLLTELELKLAALAAALDGPETRGRVRARWDGKRTRLEHPRRGGRSDGRDRRCAGSCLS